MNKDFKYCGLYSPQELYNKNWDELFDLTFNLFEFEGLSYENSEYLTRLLLTKGYAVIDGNLDVFDSTISGVNRYNLPYLVETISVDSRYSGRKMTDGLDCVICYNTSSKLSPTPILGRLHLFANILSNIDLSIQTCIFNSRTPYIFETSTPEGSEAFRQMYNDVASGKPAVLMSKSRLIESDNDNFKLTRVDYVTDNLMALLQGKKIILNEYLESLGLYVPPIEKRERLVVNETFNSLSELGKYNLKAARDEFIDKTNNLFNTNLKVRMRGDLDVGHVRPVQEFAE